MNGKAGASESSPSQDGRIYQYVAPDLSHSHLYLLPTLTKKIGNHVDAGSKALDYGCGNGVLTRWLAGLGFDAMGVDLSPSGIEIAQSAFAGSRFSVDVSAENLQKNGPFTVIICIEVIAHCFDALLLIEKLYANLAPGGLLLLSTPYHGYWKYLAMALAGKTQKHLDTQWDGAFVHYFTPDTISNLLKKVGFTEISIEKCGRIPPLAKSMIVCCTKTEISQGTYSQADREK